LEIKKLNTRIVEKVIPQIQNTNLTIQNLKAEINKVRAEVNRVRSGNKTVNQQIEILSSVIPAMQGSMEQSQDQTLQEIQSLGKRLTQLEAQIKSERENKAQHQKAELAAIKQEISANLQRLREVMAKDMERMAQLNQSAFQELIKNNEKRLNDQNVRVDKSIAVMTEIAKGGSKTSETLASLQAGVVENSKSLFTRETMVALKDILDKRLVEIDKTQQALQMQNDKSLQNVDLIKQNLLVADQKINKLAEVLKILQIQGSEVGRAKSDLINEKITRLIEILKAIATEQGKMEKLIASQGGKGSNKKLMDALADLKRKANVNISRNDSILKKLKK
jgi:hypothetical protein